jgi:hypothetical protein
MKVFRLEFVDFGEYDTLTEKELHELYAQEEIDSWKGNDMITFKEIPYTVRQLNRARKLHSDEDYCERFEEECSITPEVYDILKYLYE